MGAHRTELIFRRSPACCCVGSRLRRSSPPPRWKRRRRKQAQFFETKIRPVLVERCYPATAARVKRSAAASCWRAGRACCAGGRRGGRGSGRCRSEPAHQGDPLYRREAQDAAQGASTGSRPSRWRILRSGWRWACPTRGSMRRARRTRTRRRCSPPARRACWSLQPVKAVTPPAVGGRGVRPHAGRRVHRRRAEGEAARALPRRRQGHAAPPREPRPHRPAADAGGSRRVPRRHLARRLREGGRPPARLAPLRRALGPPLARPRPLRRERRLQGRRRPPQRLAVPRLRHPAASTPTSPTTASSGSRSPATSCGRTTRRPASPPRSTATTPTSGTPAT